MTTSSLQEVIEGRAGSLPVPLAERNWGGWLAAAVATTAGVASWSFVVGGFTGYYVDARQGTATMIAGALIGQLLVTLRVRLETHCARAMRRTRSMTEAA